MTLSLLDRSSFIAFRHPTNVPAFVAFFIIGLVLRGLAQTICANVSAFARFCTRSLLAALTAGFDVPGTDVLEPIRGVKLKLLNHLTLRAHPPLWATLRQA